VDGTLKRSLAIESPKSMLKFIITAVILLIELILYYEFNPKFSYPFRELVHVFLLYWYYSERKNVLNLTDKLFLISTAIPLISPIPIYIFGLTWGTLFEAVLLLISYQIIIIIFIREGAKFRFTNKTNTLIKVFIPYVFFPLAYFLLIIAPLAKMDVIAVTFIYLAQMMYMAALSAYLPFPEKSKWYISLAMFFVLFASGASVHRVYISHYEFDHAIVRIFATLCRAFLIVGLINRFNTQPVFAKAS